MSKRGGNRRNFPTAGTSLLRKVCLADDISLHVPKRRLHFQILAPTLLMYSAAPDFHQVIVTGRRARKILTAPLYCAADHRLRGKYFQGFRVSFKIFFDCRW